MSTLFKDYGKEVHDFLTEPFSGGLWKIKSKQKVREGMLVNPCADAKGVQIKLDCLLPWHGVELMAKARPTGLLGQLKHTRAVGGTRQKTKLSMPCVPCSCVCDGELEHEGHYAGGLSLHDRLTREVADGFLSYAVTPTVAFGGGVSYCVADRKVGSWSVGGRALAPFGGVVHVTTCGLQRWVGGVVLDARRLSWGTVKLGSQLEYGRHSKTCHAVAGVEITSNGVKDTKLCGKIDNNGAFGVALVRLFANAWRAALSVEGGRGMKPKIGVVVTRE